MFGPYSRKNGWNGLNFIHERTRKYGVIFGPNKRQSYKMMEKYADSYDGKDPNLIELRPNAFDIIHENFQSHINVKVCMERFLSIWEE